MICVSLGRTRHKHMIAEHRHLAENGVQLVELRLDYIGRAIDLTRLLKDRPTPVVVTNRRREDGGRWMGTEAERQMVLRSAIVAGVEYVDLEADIAGDIPRYGQTKRVVSYHDFDGTPDDLPGLHAEMATMDADVVKIACQATTIADTVRMMEMVRQAKLPTIGICMGEIGMMTRILAGRLGSPFTFASYSTDRTLAPGQLNYKVMRDLYRFDEIDGQTELFGVVADPVAHSHSPLIHNRAFQDAEINARYLPFRVPADDLNVFIDACPRLGIRGISVTIPHKERALAYCTQAEQAATGIGAINTMIFDEEERIGYNTDYRAAMDCINAVYQAGRPADSLPVSHQSRRVLILGAGGVARAIAWGMKQRGAEVTISSRTEERAVQLAHEIGTRSVPWEQRHEVQPQLLVNGTPVGMHPHVDDCPYDPGKLNQLMVVFDTVYNPESTMLIKHARNARSKIITGVDMFVRQAAYQFKLFTGREAPSSRMREAIKEATSPVRLNP
ncbi:MAG: shikimate dehydrogenase [Planctomycetaceae bacterium]|nr:MAG: shikimate dehydrogenase [Planctomycetaceae bacterium]